MAVLKTGTNTHITGYMILIRGSAQTGDTGGKEEIELCVYGVEN
jgi:hypothetical protein